MSALEQPKKPVGGAYGVFLNEKRPEFMKACAGQAMSAVSKMGGAAWGKLSDKEKAPYQKKYESNKAQFEKDMAAFIAAGGEKTKGIRAQRSEKRKAKEGKLKKDRDPNKPKKPAGGAFGVFLSANRADIAKKIGTARGPDVVKAASEQWKSIPAAQKKKYEEQFAKKQAEWKAAMEEYKKNLPEAEDEGDEEEDDAEEGEEEEEDEEESPKKKSRKAGA